ncbi:MAG: parallel beta-helix domain-containing protein [Acidobacteriota bacterium]
MTKELPARRATRSRLNAWWIAALVLLSGLAAVFLAPIAALDPPRRDDGSQAEIERRAAAHWAKLESANGLALPFPEPLTRPENPSTPAKIELGRLLFFDPILSGDDTLSCAHCHHPDLGFSDARGRSMGRGGVGVGPARSEGVVLRRASPTVWNAAFNHLQFWDGRAVDLEDQAGHPIVDVSEMAENRPNLVAQLQAIPEYLELFHRAFADEDDRTVEMDDVTFERITFAIAAFERTLVSDDSPFDRYARGDRSALTPTERRGLNVFRSLETRCFECHNVPTFANADFKVVGVPDPPDLEVPDLGRAEIVSKGDDASGTVRSLERAFKVPTLRNVALTAPYMHNGAFATLAEVVDFYAQGGGAGVDGGPELSNLDDKIRPFDLADGDREALIAFLHALTDDSALPEVPATVPSGLPVVERVPRTELLPPQTDLAHFVQPQSVQPQTGLALSEEPRVLRVTPDERIQWAIDRARPGDVIEIEPGVYHEALTLDVSGITLRGLVVEESAAAEPRRPVLDGRGELADAMIGAGSELVIEGLDIRRYTANGIMINLGRDIVFRDLRIEDTGLYGLYPVEVQGVLVEGCTVTGARDAGIYVGQSRDIIVRGNTVHGNVTGIEIENSLDAVVEDNDVYDNAGGILVFALPDVPSKEARGCRVVGNRVRENNHENFADPSAIVAAVPSGTGVLVLAADDVEITGNEIVGNDSFGVAVSGLVSFLGARSFDVDPLPDRVVVAGNRLERNGGAPARQVLDAGYDGADLLWDLTGDGNLWDQPGASRLPYALPSPAWSPLQRRANRRLWTALAALTGG